MINFQINTILVPVLESSFGQSKLRIIDINLDADQLLVITLEKPLRKPWVVIASDAQFEIEHGVLRTDQGTPAAYMLKPEDQITEKEKLSREQSWDLIKGLVEGQYAGDLFFDGEFGRRVAEHATAVNRSRIRIYKLLYRYWAYGQSKNVFLWQSTEWGAPGKRKSYKEGAQPGRPPLYRGIVKAHRAIRLSEFDRNCIEISFLRYVNKKEASVQKAFDWMITNYYRDVLADGSMGDVKQGMHPTINQFRTAGKEYFDRLAVLKGHAGQIRWQKDHRAIKGSAVDGLSGPAHRYEIDATIADIYLVHRVNRNWIIGRPVLYVVVDAYSRMIVGMHVGLEGPSWEGARHALYNSFTSKVHAYISSNKKKEVGHFRVDWLTRDNMLEEMVKSAATEIETMPGAPIKVSLAAICRQLSVPADTFRHKEKLLKTMAVIQQCVESQREYQIRKLAWASSELKAENKARTKSSLLRKSNIRVCYLSDRLLRRFLDLN